MFIIQLKFSENKSLAKEYMEAHKAWLQKGFDDGIFILAGSIQPNLGGGIIARDISREGIESFVAEDPFVKYGVVVSEIIELKPSKSIESLAFLIE